MSKIAKLKRLLNADTLSKREGVYTARKGFFYTSGRTPEMFKNEIENKLLDLNLFIEIIDYGEIWKSFKGGASVANSSHWYVKFKIN
jgi:hypothetical protein